MSDQHKPLTAAEIEDDKCPHNCPYLGIYAADGHGSWPCRALGRGLLDTYDMGATGGPNEPFRPNDCPRLLSLLTPPTDAALREAVEWIEEQLNNGWWEELAAAKARILLSHVRAVQAPRPPLDLKAMVDRFLAWPLPDSVCADKCSTMQGYPHRSGTNLLTASQATEMLMYVLADAAQTPRLITKQVECLKNTHIALTTNGLEGAAWELRAAFPELAGEV